MAHILLFQCFKKRKEIAKEKPENYQPLLNGGSPIAKMLICFRVLSLDGFPYAYACMYILHNICAPARYKHTYKLTLQIEKFC